MAERHQYFLRKGGRQESVQIPVDIRISDDTDFMNVVLNGEKQVDNQSSDSSDSELDFDELVNSDQEMSDENMDQNASSSRTGPSDSFMEQSPEKATGSEVQNQINLKILDQLNKIGKRLDKIESDACKKTNDKSKVKSSKTVAKTKKVTKQKAPAPVETVKSPSFGCNSSSS